MVDTKFWPGKSGHSNSVITCWRKTRTLLLEQRGPLHDGSVLVSTAIVVRIVVDFGHQSRQKE